MKLIVGDFLGSSFHGLVFEPGRDGKPIARLGRLIVLPARGERVQVGAPYRPERLIDRDRFLIAAGLRPLGWPRSAVAREGHAVGTVPQALNVNTHFRVPLTEPVPDGVRLFGDFVEEGGRIMFAPTRCACGAFASGWVAGRPMCPACAEEWWKNRPIPANDRDGGGGAFFHDFEGDE